MKKFYRRGDGCGRDGKIYKSRIENYKPKSEVCELGGDICKSSDEIYEPKGEARDFNDEIYGLIGAAHKRIRKRSCGAKAAGGDV